MTLAEPPNNKEKNPADITTIIHFDGILHRFQRTELRPVHFGLDEDCSLLLVTFSVTFLAVHLIALSIGMLAQHQTFRDISDNYLSDKLMMTGLLLTCWYVGYNMVSLAIYKQFESFLERDAPPDDFEFVAGEEIRGDGSSVGFGGGQMMVESAEVLSRVASQTLLVTMPSGELVIGTNTRTQSKDTIMIMNN